jgi:hypothetical protein
MEGDMRGPSAANCEKSFVRTGIWPAAMTARTGPVNVRGLVQIEAPRPSLAPPVSS